MTTHVDPGQQPLLDPDDDGRSKYGDPEQFGTADLDDDRPLRPINWNLLSADEALVEWLDLNGWVTWLRLSYGLPPTVVPPYWHRHDELVWELSALHTHWLNAYDTEGTPSGPIGWHRDFAEARNRLREWVSTAGCRLDRDRPTRQTTWPGEADRDSGPEVVIVDRTPTSTSSWPTTSPPAGGSKTRSAPPRDAFTAPVRRCSPQREQPSRAPPGRREHSDWDPPPTKGIIMLLAHAATLAEARSYLAALADHARTVEASSAYERALIELDWVHGDDTPALDTAGITDDCDIVMALAVSAVQQLADYGVDALHIELVLASLADAHALDEP